MELLNYSPELPIQVVFETNKHPWKINKHENGKIEINKKKHQ